MRGLLIAFTLSAAITAVHADDLPRSYIGVWRADVHNDVTLGPRSLEAPGESCRFTSIKAKDQNPTSDTNQRNFIVDMTCGFEDARRPVKIRHVFLMRRISGEDVLIDVDFSQPRIDVLRRIQ
jgi:hypothetical protein